MGYIKRVYQKNGKDYLDIDYIQWLMGDAASKAMWEDGRCEGLTQEKCYPPNGYYIRNQNPQIRTFEVAKNTMVTLLYLTPENPSEKVSFSRFQNVFNSTDEKMAHFKNAPFNIELEGNTVFSISQQYVP